MEAGVNFPRFVRKLIEEQLEKNTKFCCRVAALYGFLRFSRKGELPPVLERRCGGKVRAATDAFPLDENAPLQSVIVCPRCAQSLLCGIYLACGRVSVPDGGALDLPVRGGKGFHFEWIGETEEKADALCALLATMEGTALPLRSHRKRDGVVLYYKQSIRIEEIFYRMGLNAAGFHLSDLQAKRDLSNYANRRTNFDHANIAKTVDSARGQVEAVRYLIERNLLSALPESLQETARLRAENPSDSLRDLMALHSEPITRSGVSHRLAKLVAFAGAHKEKSKKTEG